MMSLWDALRMNMMISYQELVRTFLNCHEVTKYIRDGIVVFANYPVEYWLCYSLLYFVVCSTFT